MGWSDGSQNNRSQYTRYNSTNPRLRLDAPARRRGVSAPGARAADRKPGKQPHAPERPAETPKCENNPIHPKNNPMHPNDRPRYLPRRTRRRGPGYRLPKILFAAGFPAVESPLHHCSTKRTKSERQGRFSRSLPNFPEGRPFHRCVMAARSSSAIDVSRAAQAPPGHRPARPGRRLRARSHTRRRHIRPAGRPPPPGRSSGRSGRRRGSAATRRSSRGCRLRRSGPERRQAQPVR